MTLPWTAPAAPGTAKMNQPANGEAPAGPSPPPGLPSVILPDPVIDRIANGLPAPGEHGKSPFLLPPPFQAGIIPAIAVAVAVPEPGSLLLAALALIGLLVAGRARRS
jgi:hypothetical protein